MKCPKCDFESTGETCPRCGVVFAKLEAPRRRPTPTPRPTTRPASPPQGTSVLNILALSIVFVIAGLGLWKYAASPSDTEAPMASPTKGPLNNPEWSGLASGSAPAVEGEAAGAERGGEALVLPGLIMDSDSETPGAPKPESGPELPRVNPANVTLELVNQMLEVARKYPNDERVRSDVGRAYLALAYRRLAEGRHRESLQAAAEAEARDAPAREVARVSARASLELRDLGGAMDWAQVALSFGPDADMYAVLGQVYYLREEMEKAVEAWKSALALRDDPTIRASLERALREMNVAGGFDRQRLSHFIVKYEGDTMESTGRMVLGSLERSYSYLKSTLGFEPAEPIVVILYAREEYTQLGGPHWSAGLFDGKVKVPVRGLVSLDRHIEGTLRHELAHAFIYAQSGNSCPRWLHEGVAEHCEGARAEEFGKMLAEKIDADGDMSACVIGQRCDVRYFYAAAASLVAYILQNRGMGGIRDLLTRLGEGVGLDQALREIVGRDEMGLVKDWQYFVKRRYL